MANDYRLSFDAETGEEVRVYLTDEEQATLDAERTQERLKAQQFEQELAAKLTDLGELAGAKVDAALTANANDLAIIDAATVGQMRDIVKRMLNREQKVLKFLSRLT